MVATLLAGSQSRLVTTREVVISSGVEHTSLQIRGKRADRQVRQVCYTRWRCVVFACFRDLD